MTVTVAQIGIELASFPTTTTAASADSQGWYVQVGLPNAQHTALSTVQNVRAGGPGFVFTLANSNAAVAQLKSDQPAATGQSVTKPILANFYYPQAVPGGISPYGVAFDPLAVGSTTVVTYCAGRSTRFSVGPTCTFQLLAGRTAADSVAVVCRMPARSRVYVTPPVAV